LREDATAVDRRTLHIAGLGFARLGSADEAIAAFERASKLDPADAVDVVNVAVGLMSVGETERARRRLMPLAQGDDNTSQIARRYLAEIDRIQQAADREIRFAELRIKALRERFLAGTATIEELMQLARSLASFVANGRTGYDWAEVTSVLETVRERDPRNVEALELLIGVYGATGPDARWNEAMRELEKIAPDSRVFEAIDRPPEYHKWYSESMGARIDNLLKEAIRGGAEAEDALQSLRALVQRFPDNDHYHMALMCALSVNSDIPGALAQAEWLGQRPNPTHERQFIVAQVFLSSGDRQRAEEHFAEAYRLARTDQDRQDSLDRLEYLRGQAMRDDGS
jgi:predicted Zn-dependent protease